MSTTAVASANVTPNHVVTLKDVAAKAGVAYSSAAQCLSKNTHGMSAKTVNRVKQAAAELGYNIQIGRVGNTQWRAMTPANSVFNSRAAETAAMNKLRSEGHSNAEIAHRCGVDLKTVQLRIGLQPAKITAANRKLAGKVRSAKAQIKKAYAQQQAVAQYNELAAQLNAQLEAAQKMVSQLSSMQKTAVKASKATGTPLLRLLPPTKIS